MNIHTAIVNIKDKKILKEKAIKFISSDSNGAETIFIGRVRNENSGKKVTAVTYDAHDQMVLKSFNSICEIAINKFDKNAKIFCLYVVRPNNFNGGLFFSAVGCFVGTIIFYIRWLRW